LLQIKTEEKKGQVQGINTCLLLKQVNTLAGNSSLSYKLERLGCRKKLKESYPASDVVTFGGRRSRPPCQMVERRRALPEMRYPRRGGGGGISALPDRKPPPQTKHKKHPNKTPPRPQTPPPPNKTHPPKKPWEAEIKRRPCGHLTLTFSMVSSLKHKRAGRTMRGQKGGYLKMLENLIPSRII